MSNTAPPDAINPIASINSSSKEIIFFYKGIFRFAGQYQGLLLAIAVAIIVQGIYIISLALIVRHIFDHALPNKNLHALITLLSIIGTLFIANTLSTLMQSLLVTKLGSKLVYHLRTRIFNKTYELPKTSLSKIEETESCRRLLGDINAIDGQPIYAVFDSIKFSAQTIFSLLLLTYLEWHMTIFALLALRFFFFSTEFFSKRADLSLRRKKQDADLLFNMIQENVLMRVAIYILQLNPVRTLNFNKNAELALKSGEKFNLNIRLTTDSTLFAINSTVFLILCIGIYFVIKGYISLGLLLSFTTLLFGIGNAMSGMASLTPQLIKAANAFKEINKFIYIANNTESQKKLSQSITKDKSLLGDIRFDEVSFAYSSAYDLANALSDINFSVKNAQFIGIVGTSGSGKSTLLKLLLKEFPPHTGKITIDGYNIQELNSQFLLSHFGVVTQDTTLFDTSIQENIRLGKLDASDEEVVAAAKLAELHETILNFSAGYQENPLGKLSPGQEQRLAIARALIRKPAILCLDEATSALDPINEAAIYKTIQNFAKNHTTLFITHRLRSMVDVDWIFVLDKGRLVEQGKHADLMALLGFYYQLWEKQNGITIDSEGRSAYIKPEWLKTIPLFSSLSTNKLQVFSKEFVLERCNAKKLVFNQGDYGDKFYLIASGIIDVFQNDKKVASLSDGDFFGEIALLADIPRTAKIVTQTHCSFLVLHHQKFMQMLNSFPKKIREQIKAKAAERQQENLNFVQKNLI